MSKDKPRDSFTLPDNENTRNSDFVLSQAWFKARESCIDCGRAYNKDLATRNESIRKGLITWKQYYDHVTVFCDKHSESLEDYLIRVRQ